MKSRNENGNEAPSENERESQCSNGGTLDFSVIKLLQTRQGRNKLRSTLGLEEEIEEEQES